MEEFDDVARAAGLDPDCPEYRLATALAQADGDLLEQLVHTRKAKGLTQQVVAERMRRDKAAVSNFERLGTDPHLSTIRRYAAAIGVMITHSLSDFATQISYGASTPLQGVEHERARVGRAWPAAELLWALSEHTDRGDTGHLRAERTILRQPSIGSGCGV